MGLIPTTTNTAANDGSTVVGVVGNTGVQIVEAMIIADVPMLGYPGVKQIWEAVFNWIAGYFTKAAKTGVVFAVIDVQTSGEETGMSDALAALLAAEKTGIPSEIQTAITNYQLAQSNLIHSDGSASIK